jgi:predicted site-specific integrase-resolvase
MDNSTPTWLTVADVCATLSITRDTLYKWRGRGLSPRFKKLPNGDLRCRVDWLDEWLEELPGDEAA